MDNKVIIIIIIIIIHNHKYPLELIFFCKSKKYIFEWKYDILIKIVFAIILTII